MSRENAHDKARRYLTEGRLTVHTITPDLIAATARGDSAIEYRVTWDPGGWNCTCPAHTPRCSHIRALKLVVLVGSHAR